MDRVGTWETSRRPQSPRRSRGHDRKSRRRSCWGRREESDGCVIPMKPRTKPTTNRRRREWREGGRSKGRRVATHAPDSEPGWRVTEAASLRIGGVQNPRSRLTFDESPVRESCTPGSGAARLAAIPAGASPANTRSPVHVVVIPSGREGDQTAESLEVKALWGRGDLVRSVKGGRATWQAVA